MAKKKGMNQYILAILCIVAIVAIVLFVTGKTSWVYVSESDLSGEAYSANAASGSEVCGEVACSATETVICYQSEGGDCECAPCSVIA